MSPDPEGSHMLNTCPTNAGPPPLDAPSPSIRMPPAAGEKAELLETLTALLLPGDEGDEEGGGGSRGASAKRTGELTTCVQQVPR